MTLHETRTSLPPAVVIERARSFFTIMNSPYATFIELIGEGCLRVHIEMGEIVVGAIGDDESTWVRGSASRGAHLLTRFLATLGPPSKTEQTTRRHRHHETHAVLSETFAPGEIEPLNPQAHPAEQAA